MGMTADRHAGGERFRCDPVCHGHVGRRVGIPVSRHRVGEPDRDAVHGCPVVPCCLMSCASPRRSYWPCSFPRAPAPRRPSALSRARPRRGPREQPGGEQKMKLRVVSPWPRLTLTPGPKLARLSMGIHGHRRADPSPPRRLGAHRRHRRRQAESTSRARVLPGPSLVQDLSPQRFTASRRRAPWR